MKTTPTPLAEITATAIKVLCREIGPVNTARFLNQFTTGSGNYTSERDRIIGNPTVDQLIAEIKQRRQGSTRAAKTTRKSSPRAAR